MELLFLMRFWFLLALVWALTTVRRRDVFRVEPAAWWHARHIPDDEVDEPYDDTRGSLVACVVGGVMILGVFVFYLTRL